MTEGVNDNCHTCWNGCPTDAGDKSRSLRPCLADANGFGLGGHTSVSDVNIVVAGGKIAASSVAYGYVKTARCGEQRAKPNSSIEVAGCVAIERLKTNGCVVVAGCVVGERTITNGRV